MAVFLLNVCKFNACGLTFATLHQLIQHIENVHLDFDSGALEQQEFQRPQCLPISYILRAFNETSNVQEAPKELNVTPPAQIRPVKRSYSPAPSLSSATPTGSEMDEDNESESEASRDSWAQLTTDSKGSGFNVMKMMKPKAASATAGSVEEEKPFLCKYENCSKRYRNMNGLKYHVKNAHTNKVVRKPIVQTVKEFKCACGKVYKTAHGLRQHNLTHQQQEAKPAGLNNGTKNKTAESTQPVQSIKGKDGLLASFVRNKAQAAAQSTLSGTNTSQAQPGDGSILKSAICGDISTKQQSLAAVAATPHLPSKKKDSSSAPNETSGTPVAKKKCPEITAPTLQQHLLSPIVKTSIKEEKNVGHLSVAAVAMQ